MKKIKIYASIILTILMMLSFGNVYAHSVDLDPDKLISLPTFIMNGNATISIKDSVTNYKLHYQWVDISTNIFNQISNIESEAKTYSNTTTQTLNSKKETYKQLKTVYDEKYAIDPSSEQTTTAYNEYKLAVQSYNDLVNEYNQKVAEYNKKIKDLTPTYIESNWKESTDNKVNRDLSDFTGEKAFVLWSKLVTSSGTSYDESIYTMNGNKPENISVTSISLSKKTLSLEVGSSETISATINPSDATNKAVVWTSSNESVATVENGKITAKSKGTTTITVKSVDGNYTATCEVTVTEKKTDDKDVAVTSISLSKKTLSLQIGNNETISATINPSNATNKSVVWTSSNESVATVENGKIIAKSKGSTTITVKSVDGNYTATCEVTVTEKKDDTTATGTLPKTGVRNTVIFVITLLSVGAIVCYRKFKRLDF